MNFRSFYWILSSQKACFSRIHSPQKQLQRKEAKNRPFLPILKFSKRSRTYYNGPLNDGAMPNMGRTVNEMEKKPYVAQWEPLSQCGTRMWWQDVPSAFSEALFCLFFCAFFYLTAGEFDLEGLREGGDNVPRRGHGSGSDPTRLSPGEPQGQTEPSCC